MGGQNVDIVWAKGCLQCLCLQGGAQTTPMSKQHLPLFPQLLELLFRHMGGGGQNSSDTNQCHNQGKSHNIVIVRARARSTTRAGAWPRAKEGPKPGPKPQLGPHDRRLNVSSRVPAEYPGKCHYQQSTASPALNIGLSVQQTV